MYRLSVTITRLWHVQKKTHTTFISLSFKNILIRILLNPPLPLLSLSPYTRSVILKDVTYDVMTALLQFMYQGVVNVKHDELPFFMKIAASLQIKGLTAHEEQQRHNHSNNANTTPGMIGMHPKYSSGHNSAHKDNQTPASTGSGGSATKRSQELHHESFSIMSKQRRTHQPPQQRLMAELLHQVQLNHHQQQNRSAEGDLSSTSEEGGTNHHNSNMTEDALMPAISLTESPFQLGHPQVKQENVDQASSPPVNNGSGSNNSTTGQSHNNGSMDKPLFNSAMKLEFGSSELQAAAAAAAAAVCYPLCSNRSGLSTASSPLVHSNEMMNMSQDLFSRSANHMEIPTGEWLSYFIRTNSKGWANISHSCLY